MDYSLSNAELVVALLIGEAPGVNGYAIRQRTEKRGLDAWAGVASSSIYNSLKILESRGLIASRPDLNKRGRGPRGQAFNLTQDGRAALGRELEAALRRCREHDPRFNIVLAGSD